MHLSGPALFAFAFRFVFTGFYTVLGASVPTSAAAGSVHTDAHAVTCQSFSISWTGGTAPFRLVNCKTPPPRIRQFYCSPRPRRRMYGRPMFQLGLPSDCRSTIVVGRLRRIVPSMSRPEPIQAVLYSRRVQRPRRLE
ncbi:hypothetical protein K438DRAFT_1271113 [Mycena galopus ATCC 62051]|nr:hypothetical protein K438DRAFT_1271113 [Mycena galopus ATCC 62051]